MGRLIFGFLSIGAVLFLADYARSAAHAQRPTPRMPRIAFLSISTPGAEHSAPTVEAFREGLRAQGYMDGRNITIDYRFSTGNEERLPEIVKELAATSTDVILAVGLPWAKAAKQSGATVPVIIVAVGDPLGAGLIDSIARPGGTITGPSQASVTLVRKKLELLNDLIQPRPAGLKVAILANSSKTRHLREARAAAETLGIELQIVDIGRLDDLPSEFHMFSTTGVSAALVLADPVTVRHRRQIVQLARQHELPVIYEGREFAETGGLMSYGPNRNESFRRAAVYVAKILRGAKPADLPVEEPSRFELVLNAKTAESLGITFPQALLLQADRVIR